jgi:hypothetical protein
MKYFGDSVSKPYKEILLTVTHESKRTLGGFLAFWGYHVNGFDDDLHCQKCLIGTREFKVHRRMPSSGSPLTIPLTGNYFYICGVVDFKVFSHQEYMQNNFHLPVRWKEGSTAEAITYNGFVFTIANAEQVPISDEVAKMQYHHRGYKYWSCRNFQFGSQMYFNQNQNNAENHLPYLR